MRIGRSLAAVVSTTLLIAFGCGGDDGDGGGSGGAAASGATSGTGGTSAAGGNGATGGASGSGASSGTGGSGNSAGTGGNNPDGGAGAGGADGGGCPTGYAECDGDPKTVCETSLSLVTSCGSCTTSCNGANGTVECQASKCAVTGCNKGYDNCDSDPNNGCEQSLVSNAQHCGECGRDCAAAGTTCAVDKCKEITVQSGLPFGTDGGGDRTWAVGDGAFFNVNYYNYNVRRIPMDGSALSVVWSATGASAGYNSLLANNTHVTWVQRGTPSVVLQKAHTASAGTNPTVLFTPQYQPYFLQISGNAYYWMSGDYQSGDTVGHVFTRSVSAASSDPGTAIVTVNQGIHGAVKNFHAGASALYWYTTLVDPAVIRTTPLAGGTPTTVPTGTVATGYANDDVRLRTVGARLYYNQKVGTSFANGIYKWDPGDAAGTQLVVHEGVRDFVVDATSIYYVDGGNKTFKAPLAGGAGVEIAAVGGIKIIHQDADSIYTIKSSCCTTTLYRILK